mmetsp:Transcript_72492/g.229118  ORF Transcript_72492/g.229118 Transcript_72492/m.229118 type:complete len:204 (+) Transcript_72492:202-813(+)
MASGAVRCPRSSPPGRPSSNVAARRWRRAADHLLLLVVPARPGRQLRVGEAAKPAQGRVRAVAPGEPAREVPAVQLLEGPRAPGHEALPFGLVADGRLHPLGQLVQRRSARGTSCGDVSVLREILVGVGGAQVERHGARCEAVDALLRDVAALHGVLERQVDAVPPQRPDLVRPRHALGPTLLGTGRRAAADGVDGHAAPHQL